MVSVSTVRASQRVAHLMDEESRPVNVGETERLASQVGGGVLVAIGLMRGGLPGLVAAGLGAGLVYRGLTGHCGLYRAVGANTALGDERGPLSSVPARHGVHVEESVTIDRPADELYCFWRDYANLPKFMATVRSVTATDIDGRRSHWVAEGPMGVTLEWDAEIHNERPGELIAWRSLEGSQVETAGSVHFRPAPGGRGTHVHVVLKVNPPGGKLGASVAKLFGDDPHRQTREDLRRFKQLMEAGEIATVEGQPSGRS